MRVPFLDLKAQLDTIRDEVYAAVHDVIDTTHFILGPHTEHFEKAFAQAHNVRHCVGTNNGTSALHLALWALGITTGDEVILPVNTFVATAEAVVLCGATPVFVDHDEYFNMDVEQITSRITPRTKVLLPVHLYGQAARMDAIVEIGRAHGLNVIEDAAQAHLSTFAGKSVGEWGRAACFSFYPGKNLGAYGEAGAVVTSDPELGRSMRQLRDHGSEQKYTHVVSGHNYRIEAMQSAVLGVKLPHLSKWTTARQAHAASYTKGLAGISEVQLPQCHPQAGHVYHLYVVQVERRNELKKYLASRGIDTGLHYPTPLHLQPCYSDLGYSKGDFPRAESSADRILSLPMYPELDPQQVSYVIESIRGFYNQ